MYIMLLPATLIVYSKATKQHCYSDWGHNATIFLFIWLLILMSQYYFIIWWQILFILLNSFSILNPSQTYANKHHVPDRSSILSFYCESPCVGKGIPLLTCFLRPSSLHKATLQLRLIFFSVCGRSAHTMQPWLKLSLHFIKRRANVRLHCPSTRLCQTSISGDSCCISHNPVLS